MSQDFRFGIRMLLKHRAFAAVALLTLTLGIGANTAIFSVVHAVLLRPLPFAQQEQLVTLWKQDITSSTPFVELSLAEVRDWEHQSESFSNVAALPATVYGYGSVLTGRGDAVQLESAKVTGAFFSVLGVQAAIGRVFNETDDQVNGPKVAILSDRIWRKRFDADPKIIGESINSCEMFWGVGRGGAVPNLALEQIRERIQDKETKLGKYLTRCSKIWLLIVEDGFGPSSYFVILDEVKSQTYESSIDRILGEPILVDIEIRNEFKGEIHYMPIP